MNPDFFFNFARANVEWLGVYEGFSPEMMFDGHDRRCVCSGERLVVPGSPRTRLEASRVGAVSPTNRVAAQIATKTSEAHP